MNHIPLLFNILTCCLYRPNSQKPEDELLANFRQQFPDLAAVSTSSAAPGLSQITDADNDPAVPLPER
jgi:hypothetical protein